MECISIMRSIDMKEAVMSELKRISMLGAGQLALMTALYVEKYGADLFVLDPTKYPSARGVAMHCQGDFTCSNDIFVFVSMTKPDIITCELEGVETTVLAELEAQGTAVYPSAKTLNRIKDKYRQKQWLKGRGVNIGPCLSITTKGDIIDFANEYGYPVVLKARFGAYDGRGNRTISSESEIEDAMSELGNQLYVEAFVPFVRELAVVGMRDVYGDVGTYPTVQTIHQNHICHLVQMGTIDRSTNSRAQAIARKIINSFGDVGVMTVELFQTENGEILVNEIAPRVHNSGHLQGVYDIDQFEQHIRVITGHPLRRPRKRVKRAVMINILGQRGGSHDWTNINHIEGLLERHGDGHMVMYQKTEHRVGRKMGHIVLWSDTESIETLVSRARRYRGHIKI